MDSYALRPAEEEDLPLILSWRNREDIRSGMVNDHVITWEEHTAWFAALQGRRDRVFLLFCRRGKPLGVVSFVDIDIKAQSCSWGFYLGEKSRPGTGLWLGYSGLEHIFAHYPVAKIKSQVLEHNVASLAFHRRLLFRPTGRTEAALWRAGAWRARELFELDRAVWQAGAQEIKAAAWGKMRQGSLQGNEQ